MAEKKKTKSSQPDGGFQRVEDLYTDYANNVYLESSVWDLKFMFGQLDQSVNPPITEQRSAITIPWIQAKILNFLLTAPIMGYEMANGKIAVPSAVVPPEISPATEEAKKADPNLQKFHDELKKLREQFFGTAPASA